MFLKFVTLWGLMLCMTGMIFHSSRTDQREDARMNAIWIGFLGVVVPHLVRLIAGPDHRFVLPGSALLGAALLLFADVIARMLVRPAELPLGIVMAVLGAPVFLHLVLRRGIGGIE